MAEGDSKTRARAPTTRFGEGFLTDIWYFAALSRRPEARQAATL